MLNKFKVMKFATLALVLLGSFSAHAGIFSDSVKYWKELTQGLVDVLSWGGLLLGIGVMIWAGFIFLKDYVFAKDDRERHFRPIHLIAAGIAGFFMAYPSAGFLFGGDLVSKNAEQVQATEFKRN